VTWFPDYKEYSWWQRLPAFVGASVASALIAILLTLAVDHYFLSEDETDMQPDPLGSVDEVVHKPEADLKSEGQSDDSQ
jgi:hypothetical protein